MQIKRFRAASVDEALRAIKAELGPDALILSTRELRSGWTRLGRGSGGRVEVVAALDRDAPSSDTGSVSGRGSTTGVPPANALEPLHRELRALRDTAPSGRELVRLREEVAALRDAVASLRGTPAPPRGDPAQHLLRRGFESSLCGELLEDAALEARPSADGSVSLGALHGALARRLDAALPPPRVSPERPVELFVGAPGAGKTTSLAKIAVRDQDACAMLASGGEECQSSALRRLAEDTGMPWAATGSAKDALERAARLGRPRLLIDTPGCSRSDRHRRVDLARLRDGMGSEVVVHWVASATTRADELREELRRFDALRPDSLILTKADEATSLAPLAHVLLDPATPPLSWIGTGARPADGLAVPDPARLARRMLGGA